MNDQWGILGNGSFARIVYDLLIKELCETSDSFCGFGELKFESSGNYISFTDFNDKNIVVTSQDNRPITIYICIGYSQMNAIRAKIFNELDQNWRNIKVNSFISKEAYIGNNVSIGRGCIILPKSLIEPSVTVGLCTTAWFGSQICHHSHLGNFIWIAARSTIGANCSIGNNCFFGISSIIPTSAEISNFTLLTAGAVSPKKTLQDSVIGSSGQVDGTSDRITSKDFIRFL